MARLMASLAAAVLPLCGSPTRISVDGTPTVLAAAPSASAPTGMARFPAGLFALQLGPSRTGPLLANFQTSCDTCIPHWSYPGRTMSSTDRGRTFSEVAQPAAPDVFKSCIPDPVNAGDVACFTYPLLQPSTGGNRTGTLRAAWFHVDAAGRTTQTGEFNASFAGFPPPGLQPFPPGEAGATPNGWEMTHDGNAFQVGEVWFMPLYGKYRGRFALALFRLQPGGAPSTAGAPALGSWRFEQWVNDGTACVRGYPRGCVPTENAFQRLADGRVLAVWRNNANASHGYNESLMAQVATTDAGGRLRWGLASPLRGRSQNGDTVPGPFGVEPKLAMTSSTGVLLLMSGRPRLYLWALPPGADPLTGTWQGFDVGALHNAAVARNASAATPRFPAEYWSCHAKACRCCTDSYTGLVALPLAPPPPGGQAGDGDDVVVTYDLLGAGGAGSSGKDYVLSMRLRVQTTALREPASSVL